MIKMSFFKCLELVLLPSYLHGGPNTRQVKNIKYKFLLFGFPLFPTESFAVEICMLQHAKKQSHFSWTNNTGEQFGKKILLS